MRCTAWTGEWPNLIEVAQTTNFCGTSITCYQIGIGHDKLSPDAIYKGKGHLASMEKNATKQKRIIDLLTFEMYFFELTSVNPT